MSDYNNPLYKFVLDENELLPVLREAAAHGFIIAPARKMRSVPAAGGRGPPREILV